MLLTSSVTVHGLTYLRLKTDEFSKLNGFLLPGSEGLCRFGQECCDLVI